jgi:hypothetical protein
MHLTNCRGEEKNVDVFHVSALHESERATESVRTSEGEAGGRVEAWLGTGRVALLGTGRVT